MIQRRCSGVATREQNRLHCCNLLQSWGSCTAPWGTEANKQNGCLFATLQEAARLLGLLALVGELQAAWGRCQAAWEAQAPAHAELAAASGTAGAAGAGAIEEAYSGDDDALPAGGSSGTAEPGATATSVASFSEAVLLSSSGLGGEQAEGASPSAGEGEGGEQGGALAGAGPLEAQLGALQRAGAEAEALPLDEFPRMLEWSEGLDGLTLLPLGLLEGIPVAPAATWLKGRPCIVPVGNLWAGCVPGALPDLD
jgi:hypothetical protein